MKYAKFELNKVVQIQPNYQEGFIEVTNDVVCGMIIEDGVYKTYTHLKEVDSKYVHDMVKEQDVQIDNLKKGIDDSIENHFDSKSKEWGYTNIDRAVSYVGSANQEWNNEAIMFKTWRDRVWLYIYDEMIKIQQGLRDFPTPESVLTEIPTLESIADELGVTY